MAKVMIVDDHPIARMAIQFLVEKEGHSVVAESGDGAEALSLIDEHHPDILVIDIDIATLDGIEVVRTLRANSYPGIIIVISGKNPEFYSPRSALSGADGFISKKITYPRSSPPSVRRKMAIAISLSNVSNPRKASRR